MIDLLLKCQKVRVCPILWLKYKGWYLHINKKFWFLKILYDTIDLRSFGSFHIEIIGIFITKHPFQAYPHYPQLSSFRMADAFRVLEFNAIKEF